MAYLDILGWKANCDSPGKLLSAVSVIHEQARYQNEHARRYWREQAQRKGLILNPMHDHIQVAVFSDNIALSMPASYGPRILDVTEIVIRLLSLGFASRGAIVIGDLFHSDNRIFGPALNCAVSIEKSTSFPRIQCEVSVPEFGYGFEEFVEQYLFQDDDGKLAVSPFLWPFDPQMGDNNWCQQLIIDNWHIPECVNAISTSLSIFRSNSDTRSAKIFDKWDYLRRKFINTYFAAHPEVIRPYLTPLIS